MSTILSTVNKRLVIHSLGDCSTAKTKPLIRHGTVNTSDTGSVEKQPT